MVRPLGPAALTMLVGCSGAFVGAPADGGASAADAPVTSEDGGSGPSDAGSDGSALARVGIVQHAAVDLGSVTSGNLAYKGPVIAGHLLVVAAKYLEPGTLAVSDDAGTVFQVANPVTTNGTQKVATFYAVANRTGPRTISFAFTPSSSARVIVLEYEGVTQLDGHAERAAPRSNGPASSGSIQASQAGTLFVAFSDASSCGQRAPTGFVLREAPGPIPGCNVASDLVTPAPMAVTASPALTVVPDDWITVLASFR